MQDLKAPVVGGGRETVKEQEGRFRRIGWWVGNVGILMTSGGNIICFVWEKRGHS